MRDGHDAHEAGHRPSLADDAAEVVGDVLGRRVVQGKQPEGLAAQPVHVEQGDGPLGALHVGRRARQGQRVGAGIGFRHGAGCDEGFQHLHDLGGTHVAQRHQPGLVARRQGAAGDAQAAPLCRALQRHHLEAGRARDEGGAGELERFLEGGQHRLAGDGLGGAQRDGALHGGIDGIADAQHVAEHALEHVADFGVLEVQDVAALPRRGTRRPSEGAAWLLRPAHDHRSSQAGARTVGRKGNAGRTIRGRRERHGPGHGA